MAKSKSTIELKYSLLNEEFTKVVGKKGSADLKNAIATWTTDKTKKNAYELTKVYIEAIIAYWQKTKLKDFKGLEVKKDSDLIVNLIYKKGRRPNAIQLDNDPKLKKRLIELVK
jgi:hypothetical protein